MNAATDDATLAHATIAEVADRLRRRELSPVDVTQLTLDRIERLNPTINAYYTVFAEQALEQARRAEAEIAAGSYRGPLHGVPIAIKDIYETGPTTCGSKSLDGYVAERDGAAVRRLKAAGAIVIGKAATYEFAFGVQTRASHFAPTRNAWDQTRECGGSSSGTAGAIAAGLAYAGMGSCTGGSIRWPAQCCFHVGLKATYGRVSRAGIYPLSWSQDHPGPLARTVTDSAHMLQGCAGYDPEDPASADLPVPDFTSKLGRDIKGMRIGVLRDLFQDGCDPKVLATFDAALPVFERLGAEIVTVPTISHEQLTSIAMPMLWADAGAIHLNNLRNRGGDYNPHTRQALLWGLLVSAGYSNFANRARAQVTDALRRAIPEQADVLVLPTTCFQSPPLILDDTPGFGARLGRGSLHTAIFNITGAPAIQVPCGFDADGLPVGLQLSTNPFDEETLLQVAYAYEQEAGWFRHRPEI